MIHLFKNKQGKFNIATIANARNQEYLSGTSQGFERRAGAIKNIRSHMKVWSAISITIQDDTKFPSKMLAITSVGTCYTDAVPVERPYVPE